MAQGVAEARDDRPADRPRPAGTPSHGAVFPLAVTALAAALAAELAPALRLGFAGDDYELLALARVGGMTGAVVPSSARGLFAKPVVSAVWAALLPLFGAHTAPWFACLIATHAANAVLLGLLTARLARGWIRPAPSASASRWAGLAAAATWGFHDRLLEPVFSISAWNHSLAFFFMLVALLALDAALEKATRARLGLFALAELAALLSYEVAAVLPAAAALMVLFAPRGTLRERLRVAGPAVAAPALLYGLLRLLLQWRSPTVSYAFVSPGLAPGNFAGILGAFLHLPGGLLGLDGSPAGGWLAGVVAIVAVLAAILLFRDRMTRFAFGWCALAGALVALLPVSSDRYDYVPFAALSLALARGLLALSPRRDRYDFRFATVLFPVLLLAAHCAWSFAAAREQARWWELKTAFHERLLAPARAESARLPASDAVLAVVWPDLSGPDHPLLRAAESLPRRFSDRRWPLYLRPAGVDGLVSASDLMTVAALPTGPFFRQPEPKRVAQAMAGGTARLFVIVPGESASVASARAPALADALATTLLSRREIPVALSLEGRRWRVSWLETVQRAAAFDAEYRRPAPSPRG